MTGWYYTDLSERIAGRVLEDGRNESVLSSTLPQGTVIGSYSPGGSMDPLTVPLSRLSFWLAAAEIGVTKAGIRSHIDAMPEAVTKYQALAYLDEAQVYRREDPLLIQMAGAEGITEVELDALWAWAAQSYP